MIEDGERRMRFILDIFFEQLGEEYEGCAYDVEFADHGIPLRRQRLITVLTRDDGATAAFRAGEPLILPITHAKDAIRTLAKWVSVAEVIASFPATDGHDEKPAEYANHPFRRVPVLAPKKYE